MTTDPTRTVLAAPAGYERWCAPGRRLLVDDGLTLIENPHNRPLTYDELVDIVPTIAAAIVGVERWTAKLFDRAPHLRILAKQGVGLDNIDLQAAQERGIRVVNAPGGNANAVAEFAVGLTIAVLRGIDTSAQSVRAGEWARVTGVEIAGSTVGIAGFGTIGRLFAKRLSGFEARLIAWDPYPDHDAARSLGVELVPLDQLMGTADVLSLHVPLLAETRGMVDAAFLARMKRGSYLVNTARGGLVDDASLVAALESGHLGGAALDVFASEPLPLDHPFRTLPNVVATGHIGADTVNAYDAISVANAQSIIVALAVAVPAEVQA